jgi:uncharacterized damage-inducible protein DinB
MQYVQVFAEQYQDVYRELLESIDSLPQEALNWVPCPGANSVAVLVTHILGNQLETLRAIRGEPTSRNRTAEFEVLGATAADLLALVVEAEAISAQITPQITPAQLDAVVNRPSATRVVNRSGLYTLAHSIVQAREHLGQIWLTRDLWRAQSAF